MIDKNTRSKNIETVWDIIFQQSFRQVAKRILKYAVYPTIYLELEGNTYTYTINITTIQNAISFLQELNSGHRVHFLHQ